MSRAIRFAPLALLMLVIVALVWRLATPADDPQLLAEGIAIVERAAAAPDAGRFVTQAAIAAVHAEAPSFATTDWHQIVVLYDLLLAHGPDPVVRMNRAIAVARRDRPAGHS